jgi:hypothetical protein
LGVEFFRTIEKREGNIMIIIDASIIGSVRTTIILPKSAQLMREDILLYPGLTCTLLCYKDISKNGLHVEIHADGKE